MVNAIEELFQIDVDHHLAAILNVPLRFLDGIVRRALRPEAVAVLRERAVPGRFVAPASSPAG